MVLLDGTSVMRRDGTPRKPIGGSLSFGSVVLSSQRQRHDGGCIGNMPSSLGMAFGISETAFAPGVLPGDVRHGIVNDAAGTSKPAFLAARRNVNCHPVADKSESASSPLIGLRYRHPPWSSCWRLRRCCICRVNANALSITERNWSD